MHDMALFIQFLILPFPFNEIATLYLLQLLPQHTENIQNECCYNDLTDTQGE